MSLSTAAQTPFSAQLRWAPLSLADPNTPTFQLGLQFNIGPRAAFSFDYGYPAPILSVFDWNSGKKNKQYFNSRIEVKYFYGSSGAEKKGLYPYLSMEGFYVPQNYIRENNWYWKDDIQMEYSRARVYKDVKGGLEIRFSAGIVLDPYIGFGVRSVELVYEPESEWMSQDEYFEEWIPSFDRRSGLKNKFHLAFGMKIGIHFFQFDYNQSQI